MKRNRIYRGDDPTMFNAEHCECMLCKDMFFERDGAGVQIEGRYFCSDCYRRGLYVWHFVELGISDADVFNLDVREV